MNVTTFVIEIAGVPAEIKCRFPENQLFFRGYITDRPPVITVEPSDEDIDKAQASFYMTDEAHGQPKYRRDAAVLENTAIHGILAEKLLSYGVLLIHGSALSIDGQAIIFIAPSGTGKSTHAGIWRKRFGDRIRMINDDKPMIRISDGKAAVYGTPWNGKHRLSNNISAPLKAIVKLERDEINHIAPMKKSDAFPSLVAHAYLSKDPVIMERVLELERQILNAADFYLLGCNMTEEAAEVSFNGIM
jgi:hypothetical protein